MSGSIALLVEDSALLLGILAFPAWGIFDAYGSSILTVNSFSDIEYARDYSISDYPQEQGGWESYNKVQQPFQAKIGFLISTARFAFLQNIEAVAASLQLVSVVTPEVTYTSANITHYDYRRTTRHGVTMLRVEVWLEEVRVTAGTLLGSTASQATGGTNYPIGQQNSNALSGNPNALSTSNSGYPISTQSTNSAYPASAGYSSTLSPGATVGNGASLPTTLSVPN